MQRCRLNMIRILLNSLKARFPHFFRNLFRMRDAILNIPACLQLLRIRKGGRYPSVMYLTSDFPKRPALQSEFAHGGAVKLTYLAKTFSHQFPSANLLYAVSSVGHPLYLSVLAQAKRNRLKIVINQNGVSLPAWDGADSKKYNQVLQDGLLRLTISSIKANFAKTARNDTSTHRMCPTRSFTTQWIPASSHPTPARQNLKH
jgi:hypothetical protein